MVQEIYIIDDDESSLPIFRELFKEDNEFKFIGVKTEQIDIALKNIPFLIIINEDAIDRDVLSVCEKIRTDEDNKITPIISSATAAPSTVAPSRLSRRLNSRKTATEILTDVVAKITPINSDSSLVKPNI